MAFWFYRGLRRGVVTTRYPASIDRWTVDLPSPPAFRPDRLSPKRADRITQACPSGAVRREGPELVVDLGRCTGCGGCLGVGGDAVVPSGAFLLATRDRAALIKRVPIRGTDG